MAHPILTAIIQSRSGVIVPTEVGTWADWISGIGSWLAVVVALGSYWWADRQRRIEQFEAKMASANQIGVKLHDLLGRSKTIYNHLFAPYEGPKLSSFTQEEEIWRQIKALVGLSEQITSDLTPEEHKLLLEINEIDFMTRFSLAWQRHQSVVLSMREFYIKRDVVQALMPAPTEMDGDVGRHWLTVEETMRFRPHSVALEMMIRTTRDIAKENYTDLQALAKRFHPTMKRHFPKRKFLMIAETAEP